MPLVVDENIELPQLALIKNYTADCTQVMTSLAHVIKNALTLKNIPGLLNG